MIYRIGAHIAAPGVNVRRWPTSSGTRGAAGFFGLYDMLGGGLSRATVFALGIMPYISASIIFQLAGGIVPSIGKMQKDEEGRKKLTQWTRYITVVIALSRRTASRCSPNRSRARSPIRVRLPAHRRC